MVLDGVYRRTEGEPDFHEARAPSRDELAVLLEKIIARLLKILILGHLVEEEGVRYIADVDADNPLASWQAVSCTYRIALGPRAGTTHIKMLPLEFMQRLAALVPRPRLHLIRFHGVLAPNAGLRAAIVPGPPQKPGDDADHHEHGAPARMGWARLLRHVFDIDLEHCPQCGGDLKIIAAIEEPAVIVRILTHLGLPARAPPRSPARPLDLFEAA